MATTSKRAKTIRQAIQLKQVIKIWKGITLNGKSFFTPSGCLPVYIGRDRTRFLIPTRFLSFPIFVDLLEKSREEFGFKGSGGIVLPCDVEFFKQVMNLLEKDEKRYGRLALHEFLKMISEVPNFDSSTTCKNQSQGFRRPLLQKARA